MRGVLEFHKYSTCKILEIDASKIKELKDFLCTLIVGHVYSPMEKE